jgi:hypothetical protein
MIGNVCVNSNNGRPTVILGILLLLAYFIVVVPAWGDDYQDKQKEQEKLDAALKEKAEGYKPVQPVYHPEKEARDQAEREGSFAQPVSLGSESDENLKDTGTPPPEDQRTILLREYDWENHFKAGGEVKDQLQLSIAAPDEPYTYGYRYFIYLGLENLTDQERILEELPANGGLSRCNGLIFRVVSNTGKEITVMNNYRAPDMVVLKPLIVSSRGVLIDVKDMDDLISTSGIFFDLVRESSSVSITLVAPELSLESNSITINMGER